MKIGHITEPNTKGQIVIPKAIRDKVGIKPGQPVEITSHADTVTIKPIVGVIHASSVNRSSYIKLLKKTRGAWGKIPLVDKKQQKIELAASKRNKAAW